MISSEPTTRTLELDKQDDGHAAQKGNAVVYGVGGAIGGAVARAFAREGAKVFLAGGTIAAIDPVAEKISAPGGVSAHGFPWLDYPFDSVVQSTSLLPEQIQCGCPLNNLAPEMSRLDEGFRKRLAKIFSEWHDGIAAALRKRQKRGVVRSDVDPDETAIFLIAANEGCWSLAKNSQDVRVLQSGIRSMIRYLELLRAAGGKLRAARSG